MSTVLDVVVESPTTVESFFTKNRSIVLTLIMALVLVYIVYTTLSTRKSRDRLERLQKFNTAISSANKQMKAELESIYDELDHDIRPRHRQKKKRELVSIDPPSDSDNDSDNDSDSD